MRSPRILAVASSAESFASVDALASTREARLAASQLSATEMVVDAIG
jgi:hypothetical protein